ncbi:MAG: heavy metal-binding domain-containing protein [Bryobacteraceae bacterium]|jgi:hypothetical protein
MPVKSITAESVSDAAVERGNASTTKVDFPPVDSIYKCPMHPEVQQDHPGNCPKCGMRLELKTATAGADDDENAEPRNMTRRFWIGAGPTLPVFLLRVGCLHPGSSEPSPAVLRSAAQPNDCGCRHEPEFLSVIGNALRLRKVKL